MKKKLLEVKTVPVVESVRLEFYDSDSLLLEPSDANLKQLTKDFQYVVIKKAVQWFHGNQLQAALHLGINRNTLSKIYHSKGA